MTIPDCLDISTKERLLSKMEYHEKAALQCVIKSSR
jgi:hypothetical protein